MPSLRQPIRPIEIAINFSKGIIQMLKLYGTSQSRAGRCVWALEEVAVKYEHLPIAIAQAREPENLKRNPNGHIPVLEDDGLIVWESMAINLYLAEKYGKAPLWPSTPEGRAGANQWSFWAMTEAEPPLVTILSNRLFLPPEQRNENAVAQAIETLKKPLAAVESHLNGREYLFGKDFTIADLNAAAVLSIGSLAGLDYGATPKTAAWLAKCTSRPANQKAAQAK
jgi:glutathione S-transferase